MSWADVDHYIADKLLGDDPALEAALAANHAAGLPAIDVSPAQGKMLQLLARSIGARRILEVGTLGGYSTIWLARALPAGGRVVTLELLPHHAEVAQANLEQAGVADRVEIRVGKARALSHPGSVIIVDNVVREGGILDPDSADPMIQGTRRLYDALAATPQVSATAIQTVGLKKWDGFVLAVVNEV